MSLPSLRALVNRLHPHRKGYVSEWLALALMMTKGFVPAARPRRSRAQTDLLMRRGTLLVLVEVKYRPTDTAAHRAISPAQRHRLMAEARHRAAHHPEMAVRIDTIAVFPHWPFIRHIAGQ